MAFRNRICSVGWHLPVHAIKGQANHFGAQFVCKAPSRFDGFGCLHVFPQSRILVSKSQAPKSQFGKNAKSCHAWFSQGAGTRRQRLGCCWALTTAGAWLGIVAAAAGEGAAGGVFWGVFLLLGSDTFKSASSEAALLLRLALPPAGAAGGSDRKDKASSACSSNRVPSGHVSKRSLSAIGAEQRNLRSRSI